MSSLSKSIVSALRRSGRLSVTTLIWGDCFSIRTTGMRAMSKSECRMSNLNLDDPGMKMRVRHGTRNVLEQLNQQVARFVRLNDRVDPAAGGAIANISLLFVALFHFLAKLLELFLRCFFVSALPRFSENGEHCIGCLRGAHHGVARSEERRGGGEGGARWPPY